MPNIHRGVRPPPDITRRVRDLIERTGIRATEAALGFGSETAYRIACGFHVHPGSVALAEKSFAALDKAAGPTEEATPSTSAAA